LFKELLSPAGNMEALKMAIKAGADAIYVGGKRFGARAFATNFTDEEMKEACFLCHLYGVKLYVTVNTMIYESELSDVLDYISFLYENHIDAIILSDIGLMSICHQMFPEFELHASTQTHIHNVEQLVYLKELGVKRVVLARELSLDEIKKFPSDIELEVFVHGALCVSYSGQCLFSSLLFHRSGNHGECAQICRLPFQLLKNGEVISTQGSYLLSPKDLNTSSQIQQLMESNVLSFKIEGRMKSSAYVYYITKMYRQLIDSYRKNKTCIVTQEMKKNASVLFGRGFTTGKMFKQKDFSFINQNTSNHQGIYLGDILEVSSKKIKIRLKENLQQGDGVRFLDSQKGMIVNFLYNERNQLISCAKQNEIVYLDNKFHLTHEKGILKTMDSLLEKEILKIDFPKIPVFMRVNISLEKGFSITLSDGNHTIFVNDFIVEKARNYPITKEKIITQLGRLGESVFRLETLDLEMEPDLFINIQDINRLRRQAVEKLIQKRTFRNIRKVKEYLRVSNGCHEPLRIFASVSSEEQLCALLSLDIDGIYVSDYSLYQKYQSPKVIYRTNRVSHVISCKEASQVLIGDIGSLWKYYNHRADCFGDYFLNIANHASVDFFLQKGIKRICISPELSDEEVFSLLQKFPNGNSLEFIVYGRLEAMVLNHCILSTNLNQEKVCQVCRNQNHYALKDRNGAIYPIRTDEFHHTHLLYHSPFDKIKNAKMYYQSGIRSFRFEFYDESTSEIEKIIEKFRQECSKVLE